MDDDEPKSWLILTAPDGREYRCEVLLLFPFEGQQYGLLENLGTGERALMQVAEDDESSRFVAVEDDALFARLIAHLEKRFVSED